MTDRKKIFSLLFGITLVAVGFFAPVTMVIANQDGGELSMESSAVSSPGTEEKPCGALDQTCKLLKTVGDFFSTIWKGFLETTLGFFAAAFGALFSGVALMVNGMIGWLMNLTVNPGNPNTTAIVKVGWKMSRDLVNLLFLIVLVFIGFATILRLQSYEMKKTLPLLLIIALLVNFSGVLVGLVVDAGNIITQFFLQGSQKIGWDSALGWPGRILSVRDMTAGQIIAGNLVQIVYYIVAIFIFFTLLAVFFIRTFVLWTLAIVAPFAFAAYILPATRSIWTKWLGALIQWSFVGVPIAFFMLFAGIAIEETKEGGLAQGSPFLTEFLGPFAALFFLFVGIGTAITMAPAGASKVMALGQQYGTKAVSWGGKAIADKTRNTLRNSPKVQAFMDRAEQKALASIPGEEKWYRLDKKLLGATTRAVGRGAKVLGSGMEEKVRQEAEKAAGKEDARGKVSQLREALAGNDMVRARAIISSLVESGQLEDAQSAMAMGKGNELNWEKDRIPELFRDAVSSRDSGAQKAIARAFAGTRTIADIEKEIEDKKKEESTLSPKVFDVEMEKLTEALAKAQAAKSNTNEQGDIGTSAQLGSIMHQELKTAIGRKRFGNLTDAQAAKIQVDEQGLTKKDREESGFTSYLEKTVAGIKTADDMKQLQDGWWKGERAMEAANRFWKGSQFQAAANQFGRTFIEGLEEFKNTKTADWF
ncbi:MAG: hypothetical protein Q8P55_01700, partial [bacterium]|nr:hypothetical protein [bacterium]